MGAVQWGMRNGRGAGCVGLPEGSLRSGGWVLHTLPHLPMHLQLPGAPEIDTAKQAISLVLHLGASATDQPLGTDPPICIFLPPHALCIPHISPAPAPSIQPRTAPAYPPRLAPVDLNIVLLTV